MIGVAFCLECLRAAVTGDLISTMGLVRGCAALRICGAPPFDATTT